MCTVSYTPTKTGFIFCSNRDEIETRSTSKPHWRTVEGQQLLFPKDELANGSWIITDESGNIACLLNGAFVKHKHQPPYQRSRGLVVLERFQFNDTQAFLAQLKLKGVEPFTLILLDSNGSENEKARLTVLRWDGEKQFKEELDVKTAHIWSSSTLYSAATAKQKEAWFKNWTNNNKSIEEFHLTRHGEYAHQDVFSDFGKGLKTVSTTYLEKNGNRTLYRYHDHSKGELTTLNFSLK